MGSTTSITSISTTLHLSNFLGLLGFLILWILVFQCAHLVVPLLRTAPLLGWAIGPLGIAPLFLHEPSTLAILLNVLVPALISGAIVYIALFTPIAPVALPHSPLIEVCTVLGGILLSSTSDGINALRDLRYPLWGEARILRTIQALRANYATIRFTAFGRSYLRDHFGSSSTDILQAF